MRKADRVTSVAASCLLLENSAVLLTHLCDLYISIKNRQTTLKTINHHLTTIYLPFNHYISTIYPPLTHLLTTSYLDLDRKCITEVDQKGKSECCIKVCYTLDKILDQKWWEEVRRIDSLQACFVVDKHSFRQVISK